MNRVLELIAIFVISGGAVADERIDKVADGCVACHRGALSLAEWTISDLEIGLRDIAEGRIDHPVPVAKLSDDEYRMLANALAGE